MLGDAISIFGGMAISLLGLLLLSHGEQSGYWLMVGGALVMGLAVLTPPPRYK